MAKARQGSFTWYEHMTSDPKAAIAFYGDVVGWKTQPFTGGNHEYTMWVSGQGPLGGVMGITPEMAKGGMRPAWMAHVQVDDLDAALGRVRKLGGKVHKEPEAIPTVGRFAVVADPQGAALLLFQPQSGMDEHDPSKDGEFCWNELHTTDSEAGFRFYSDLLGWKILDEMEGPMGKYRIFGVGDRRLGGIMPLQKGAPMPPMWMFYASTSDLDGAVRKATAKGAKIMNGPMDVPGGRVAQLTDPQGAAFALHQAK